MITRGWKMTEDEKYKRIEDLEKDKRIKELEEEITRIKRPVEINPFGCFISSVKPDKQLKVEIF